MNENNYYFLIIWLVIIAFHLLLTRSRFFNDPFKVLEDCGDSVILRATAFSMMFNNQSVAIEKSKIAKIQRAKHTISLFTHSNNAFDIWVVGKYTDLVWERAKSLFPEAKVVVISDLETQLSKKD